MADGNRLLQPAGQVAPASRSRLIAPARAADLPGRVFLTAGCIVLWQLTTFVAAPGIAPRLVRVLIDGFTPGLLDPARYPSSPVTAISIGTMGMRPWFNALVVVILLSVISDTLRPRIAANLWLWVVSATFFLAAVEAYGLTVLWQSTAPAGLPFQLTWMDRLIDVGALTATTMLLVFLAQVVDERGLGYGCNPFLFYAITLVPTLSGPIWRFVASAWILRSADYLLAAAIVLIAVIAIGSATTLALLAYRTLGPRRQPAKVSLLVTGVVLPPLFANSIMFLPVIAANFLASAPSGSFANGLATFIRVYWTDEGPSWLGNVIYLVVYAALIVSAAVFVVGVRRPWDAEPGPAVTRLGIIAGLLLVVIVVGIPEAASFLTGLSGHPFEPNATLELMYIGLGWPTLVALATAYAGVRPPKGPRGVAF